MTHTNPWNWDLVQHPNIPSYLSFPSQYYILIFLKQIGKLSTTPAGELAHIHLHPVWGGKINISIPLTIYSLLSMDLLCMIGCPQIRTPDFIITRSPRRTAMYRSRTAHAHLISFFFYKTWSVWLWEAKMHEIIQHFLFERKPINVSWDVTRSVHSNSHPETWPFCFG